MRSKRWLAAVVALTAVAAGCTSHPPAPAEVPAPAEAAAGRAADADATEVTLGPAVLPAPPVPTLLDGEVSEQVRALADAFENRDDARSAAMLAGFHLAGVPVVDGSSGSLTTAGDTVGVPWSIVWAVSALAEPGVRIPLSQVAEVFAADGVSEFDAAAASTTLLTGLREALAADPTVAGPTPIALLVREESRRAGAADPADPDVSPESVQISVPTFAILVSAGLLTGVASTIPIPPVAMGPGSQALSDGTQLEGWEFPSGCAEDAAGLWALWIASKVAGGVAVVDIPPWEGPFVWIVERLQARYSLDVPVNLVQLRTRLGQFASVTGFLAAALSTISLITALAVTTADVDLEGGEPLVRTKSTREHGAADNIAVTIISDYSKLDPQVTRDLNCFLVMAFLIGNNSTLPVPGPLEGVTVRVHGQQGFGQGLNTAGSFVVLTGGLSSTTDKVGTALFPVAGRMQVDEVPRDASEVNRTFSVAVEATADPQDAHSIVRQLLDGFLCGVSGFSPLACVDAVIDTVKQFYWRMDERYFALTDWGQEEWTGTITYVEEGSVVVPPPPGWVGEGSASYSLTWTLTVEGQNEAGKLAGTLSGALEAFASTNTSYQGTGRCVAGGPIIVRHTGEYTMSTTQVAAINQPLVGSLRFVGDAEYSLGVGYATADNVITGHFSSSRVDVCNGNNTNNAGPLDSVLPQVFGNYVGAGTTDPLNADHLSGSTKPRYTERGVGGITVPGTATMMWELDRVIN